MVAQLHGQEGEREIRRLRELTDHPLIQAFRIDTEQDVERANASTADYVLLDSGAGGTGTVFDWDLLQAIRRRISGRRTGHGEPRDGKSETKSIWHRCQFRH